MIVRFEETGEEREVTGFCARCFYGIEEKPVDLVSPSGMVHASMGYGMTYCGRDATGDGWWWRA